jgi:hypothetical protein
MRDAISEAAFFSIYANMFHFYLSEHRPAAEKSSEQPTDVRERAFVKEPLGRIAEGGYTEAFARVAFLLSRKDEPLPLSRLTMRQDLAKDYANLIPDLPLDKWRRIRGEQEIIVRHALDQAVATLPKLLDADERERLLTLIDRVIADKRIQQTKPTAEQVAMVERVRGVLRGESSDAAAEPRLGVKVQSLEGKRHEPQA